MIALSNTELSENLGYIHVCAGSAESRTVKPLFYGRAGWVPSMNGRISATVAKQALTILETEII